MTSESEIWSWKHSEPLSLLAQEYEYAAALMKVTLGGFCGVTGRTGFRRSRTESGSYGSGADDRSVSKEGDLLEPNCHGCWKKMLPNTQSIEGL